MRSRGAWLNGLTGWFDPTVGFFDRSALPEDGAAIIKEPAGASKVNGPLGRSHPIQCLFAVAGQQGKVRIWSRKGRALSARLLWAYSSAG